MRTHWKSIWVKAMFVLFVISAVVNCGGSPAFSAPASLETYKIGGIWPMTGPTAASGQYLRDGAQLAIDEINAAGGINGHMMELITEDSKGFPRDGVMAYTKLLEVDHVVAVLPTLSSVVVALLPMVNEGGNVILMNTLGKSQDIVGAGPHIFSIAVPTSIEGVAMAQYAWEDLDARSAVLLYIKADTGVSYDQYISAEWERLGGKMLTREGHDGGLTDFRAVLTKVKQLNPDVVFIASLFTESAAIVKQMRELGIPAEIVTYGTVYAAPFTELAGEAADGVIAINTSFDPESERPRTQKFVADYQGKYGYPAILDSSLSYDAVYLLAEAMKTGGTSSDGIAEGLMQIRNFDGAVSVYGGFSEEHTVSRPVAWRIHKDGKWVRLEKPDKK